MSGTVILPYLSRASLGGSEPRKAPIIFVNLGHEAHDPGNTMLERPARVQACLERLSAARANSEISFELRPGTPELREAAGREGASGVHDPAYLNWLEKYCVEGGGWIDGDTPALPRSFDTALGAAGACVAAVDAAFDENAAAFCLVRPLGHHAESDRAMGFCLINNVAVAAGHALNRPGVNKVAILDFDVHHGNGTQQIFWSRPDVLYVSLHQFPWFPWISGSEEETGEGAGSNANVNIPLHSGSGDSSYIGAIDGVAAPAIERFKPDLLLASAGFDAHVDDPLSEQQVTTEGFGQIAERIVQLASRVARAPAVFVLEGGYNLGALGSSLVETIRAMNKLTRSAPLT